MLSYLGLVSLPFLPCFDGEHVPKPQIDEEEKWIKDKEQWLKDGEKYILGWNSEEAQVSQFGAVVSFLFAFSQFLE